MVVSCLGFLLCTVEKKRQSMERDRALTGGDGARRVDCEQGDVNTTFLSSAGSYSTDRVMFQLLSTTLPDTRAGETSEYVVGNIFCKQ
jgi:hypothetical protein